MGQLKNYDPNNRWGKHLIKVTFQQWEYSGSVVLEIGGNTKGLSVMSIDSDRLYEAAEANSFAENSIQLRDLESAWFAMVLKDKNGDELIHEDEWDRIEETIVGLEIIKFEIA